MSVIEVGKIVDIKDDFLLVQPFRKEVCEHCEIKELCMGNIEGILKVKKPGKKVCAVGDTVEFEVKLDVLNLSLMKISSLGISAILGGALLGYYLNPFKIDVTVSAMLFSFAFITIYMAILIKKKIFWENYPMFRKIIKSGGENEHNK